MKKTVLLLSFILLAGCQKENLENAAKPERYASAVEAVNDNIVALQRLIDAYEGKRSIKACLPFSNGKGYAVMFSDGSSASFSTEDIPIGAGKTVLRSPVVGIRAKGEGLVWTISGKEKPFGEMPVMKITAGMHWVITSGDITEDLGQVEEGMLRCWFSGIREGDGDNWEITFTDGTYLSFPKYVAGSGSEILPTRQLRRPISPKEPMWLIHIDSWVHADPEKIIDLIPDDILPYVVFNISMSVSGDRETGEWDKVEYGYETAKSWLRSCAQRQVWATIQPSSGAYCHFPDLDSYEDMTESLYAEFYKEYPNFIGFNYCEQFWGFTDLLTVSYEQRLKHWTHLMRLTHEYGGYLILSHCAPYWSASSTPVAMMKRDSDFRDICAQHPENVIICEKYTISYGYFATESMHLGMWLSGHAGNYGIRFDTCGWNAQEGSIECPSSTGAVATVEHVLLTGQTVIDGPELIWQECFHEISPTSADNGYQTRQWEKFPQFIDTSIEVFRRILDGTVRIPDKEEVMERTKVMLLNDNTSGSDVNKYSTPSGLYEGLYQMDDDGDLLHNYSWFKKTGRYPTIPLAYQMASGAEKFEKVMTTQQYSSTWSDKDTKIRDFNAMFPQEYTGDVFAGRNHNKWVIYNPYKDASKTADGNIGLQYSTCSALEVTMSAFGLIVATEHNDGIDFWLQNYDENISARTDVITVKGCSARPQYTWRDTGEHAASQVKESWNGQDMTLEVSHNGSVLISMSCQGKESDRKTSYPTQSVTPPQSPEPYLGTMQFEAENFDYKNINRIYKSGYDSGITNYTALGFLSYGTSKSAAVRETVNVRTRGLYTLSIKYMAQDTDVKGVEIHVNGTKISSPNFRKTGKDSWGIHTESIELNYGSNTIELKTVTQPAGGLLLDNITLSSN